MIVEPALEKEQLERNIAIALAFGALCTVVFYNLGDPRTARALAVRVELTTIGTQMAVGRIVRSDVLSIYNRGVQNMMSHLEILLGEKQSSTVTKVMLP